MSASSDRPMLFRFAGYPYGEPEKVYGPRPLSGIVRDYADRADCAAAPQELADQADAWRPAPAWAAEYPALAANESQQAEMQKWGIAFDERTTVAMADALLDQAALARKAARGRKAPTKLKLDRLKSLGLSAPPDASRETVDALIEREVLRREGLEMAAAGMLLPDEGATPDNIQSLRDALSAFELGVENAAEVGFRYERVGQLPPAEMNAVGESLEEFWSVARDLRWRWEALKDEGELDRVPTKAQERAILPELFALVRARGWESSDFDFSSLALQALAVKLPARTTAAPTEPVASTSAATKAGFSLTAESAMVYRFSDGQGDGRIYGPIPLDQLVREHGDRADCRAAPQQKADDPGEWSGMAIWGLYLRRVSAG